MTIHADLHKKNLTFYDTFTSTTFWPHCPCLLKSGCLNFASSAHLCSNFTPSSFQGPEISTCTGLFCYRAIFLSISAKCVTETKSGICIPELNKHEYLSLVHCIFPKAFLLVQHKWKQVASRYSTIVASTTMASETLAERSRGKKRRG